MFEDDLLRLYLDRTFAVHYNMLEMCDKERKAQGIQSPHKFKNMTRDEARFGMVEITSQFF